MNWDLNEHGLWCPSCGTLLSKPAEREPTECDQCGFPDGDKVADYHGFDDDDGGECWNCAGEGFVANCFEEYACVDPEGGCDLCLRRCEICA